jgi:hypothetical protein
MAKREIITCDRCTREIEKPYYVVTGYFTEDVTVADSQHSDLCQDCHLSLISFMRGVAIIGE